MKGTQLVQPRLVLGSADWDAGWPSIATTSGKPEHVPPKVHGACAWLQALTSLRLPTPPGPWSFPDELFLNSSSAAVTTGPGRQAHTVGRYC